MVSPLCGIFRAILAATSTTAQDLMLHDPNHPIRNGGSPSDHHATVKETELPRTISDSLDCSTPPIFASSLGRIAE